MTLYEFNNLDLEEKYTYVWYSKEGVSINSFRNDGDYKYLLWDCGTFFVETCALNSKTIKIERHPVGPSTN